MSQEKYIGMDVHQATISVALRCTSVFPRTKKSTLTAGSLPRESRQSRYACRRTFAHDLSN